MFHEVWELERFQTAKVTFKVIQSVSMNRPKPCFASGESWKHSTRQKTLFTRSAITPLKANRFGWNLKHCEHIGGGWPRQILGAISALATVWEAAETLFFWSGKNALFHRFPVGQSVRHLNTTTSIGEAVKYFGTEFWKFYRNGSFFQKKNAKIAHRIFSSCNFKPL